MNSYLLRRKVHSHFLAVGLFACVGASGCRWWPIKPVPDVFEGDVFANEAATDAMSNEAALLDRFESEQGSEVALIDAVPETIVADAAVDVTNAELSDTAVVVDAETSVDVMVDAVETDVLPPDAIEMPLAGCTSGFCYSIAGIALGRSHSCVIEESSLKCWGANDANQLGSLTAPRYESPMNLPGMGGVRAITAHRDATCSISTMGVVRCWGGATEAFTGGWGGSRTPVQVNIENAEQLALGNGWLCARQTMGAALCVGRNEFGQLATGTMETSLTPTAMQRSGLPVRNVTQILAGTANSCVLAMEPSDRFLYCAGDNAEWVLRRSSTPPPAFSVLTSVENAGVATTACIGDHILCTSTSTETRCRGRNNVGQLGLRHETSPYDGLVLKSDGTPLRGVTSLACGDDFVCAITTDRTVWCWGNNNVGQLAQGDTMRRAYASRIRGLDNVSLIAAGASHACALRTTGPSVFCWGNNAQTQVAPPATSPFFTTPVYVPFEFSPF